MPICEYTFFSMQTKVEGIILSKLPYKERDLIAQLLLRGGRRLSVLFKGGRGGGKKKKATGLELGYMLKVDLSRGKSSTELFVAREWSLLWGHRQLRDDHRRFYLACFYLEMIRMISVEADLFSVEESEDQLGLFRVLSNGLFYLEDGGGDYHAHLFMFLAKLMQELGIYPSLGKCCYCEAPLGDNEVSFGPEGIYCRGCRMPTLIGAGLLGQLAMVKSLKYSQVTQLTIETPEMCRQLINYICHNYQLSINNFKSLALVL